MTIISINNQTRYFEISKLRYTLYTFLSILTSIKKNFFFAESR